MRIDETLALGAPGVSPAMRAALVRSIMIKVDPLIDTAASCASACACDTTPIRQERKAAQ